MDTQQKISERIKELLKERGLSVKPFGERLGIFNLGRMLNNERNWTFKNLEKIAGALGVTVSALAQDFADIPILLEVNDADLFPFPLEIKKEAAIGWVSAPIPVKEIGALDKFYAIKFPNHPHWGGPVTLIAKKDTGLQARNNDYVVYCCPKGNGHIGRVRFHTETDKIGFRSINPMGPLQDELMDRGQLRMMDRVTMMTFDL